MHTTLDELRDSLRVGLSDFKLSSDSERIQALRHMAADAASTENLVAFAGVALALLGDPSFIGRAFEAVARAPEVAREKPASAFLGALTLIVPYPREFDRQRDAQAILTWYREHQHQLRWDAAAGLFTLADN
jgi:hypothetical protein